MRCCRPLARLFALRTRMKWFRSADALVRSGHKLGFSVGSAPTLSLSQREVLLLHHEKHLKCILRPDWLRLRIVALCAGICRFAAWRSHRHRLVHNEECRLLQHAGCLKWSLRWDSRPHAPVYKTGAFLSRPRRRRKMTNSECRMTKDGNAGHSSFGFHHSSLMTGALTRTCTSSFHLRKVACMALTL